MASTKLIIGLGNPGREHHKTRHNLGFMVVQELARGYSGLWKKSRQAEAMTADIQEDGNDVLLALPLTFMNLSGFAVRDLVHFKKVSHADILVVCDDIWLAFGEMRLRSSGSSGGHNGLGSIIQELGTEDFARLRMGVGAAPSPDRQADHVLSRFNARETKELGAFIGRGAECCRLWLKGQADQAMAAFNQRKDKKDND